MFIMFSTLVFCFVLLATIHNIKQDNCLNSALYGASTSVWFLIVVQAVLQVS